MRVGGIADVRRYVSEQIENWDFTCYEMSYDDILDEMTSALWDSIRSRNDFTLGADIEISDKDLARAEKYAK